MTKEKTIMRRSMSFVSYVAVVIVAALYAACDQGASDQDFIAACLEEGKRGGVVFEKCLGGQGR